MPTTRDAAEFVTYPRLSLVDGWETAEKELPSSHSPTLSQEASAASAAGVES
jgi:hypothetical protein